MSSHTLDLADSYVAIRERACAVLGSRDVVLVQGPDAQTWLQGQLSQDLEPVGIGQSAETLVLSPQGKVDAYCRATILADDAVLLDTEAGRGEALHARLMRFHLRVKSKAEVGSATCLMVRGPGAEETLAASGLRLGESSGRPAPDGPGGSWSIAVPVRWPGFDGFDLLGAAGSSFEGIVDVPSGDPEAFEAARIEAGVPSMGREITDKTIPQEAGALVEHAVSFTKGCYTGQELVARLDARGNNVARRLRGVVLPPAATKAGPGTVLVSGEREVGRLTSVAWSPRFSAPVALAYLRRDVVPPATATLAPDYGEAEIRELPLSIG